MSVPVPVVRLAELHPPAAGAGGMFVPVIDAAPAALPRPFPLLRDGGWRPEVMPHRGSIGPLGLSLLRDVTLCGSGYLFSDGRFVLEEAHTSRVALQWLRDERFPDNPFTTPPEREIDVGRPGLVVFGPGFPIWGHVLLDYLPRIALARRGLGARFGEFVIPVPEDAPGWLAGALAFFCGIHGEQLLPYHRHRDRLRFAEACLPSFAHDGEHVPHPFATEFFRSFVPERSTIPAPAPAPKRRLCLSRRRFEIETRSAWRVFEGREAFERLAVERDYEVVCPEDLDWAAQVALFAGASHLVGEFGSGMHNAVFSPSGTRVGCFPFNNALQAHIAAAGGHALAVADRSRSRTDARGVVFFDVDPDDLAALLDRMEET